MGVEGGKETVSDVLGDRLLQAPHDNRPQDNGSVILQAVYGRCFGDRVDGGGLQICREGGLCQGEVEKPGEDPCQLLCTCLNHRSWDAVRTSSFPGVHCP